MPSGRRSEPIRRVIEMENPENQKENINRTTEKARLRNRSETRRATEAGRAARMTKRNEAELSKEHHRESTEGVQPAAKISPQQWELSREQRRKSAEALERKTSSREMPLDETMNLLRKAQTEGRRPSGKLEQLGRTRHPSDAQRRELLDELEASLDRTDPHWREADRRTAEGAREFERNAAARRVFCHTAGTEEHKRWEKEIFQSESKVGRMRGKDFQLEAVIHHPDGKPVRLDYVDYRRDIIVDRKPFAQDETEEQLKARYEAQRKRHIEAYEHATGRKVLEYHYSLYTSPRDT